MANLKNKQINLKPKTAIQTPSQSSTKLTKSAKRRLRQKARWGLSLDELNIPMIGNLEGLRLGSRGEPTVGLAEYAKQSQVRMPRVTSVDRGRFGSIDILKGSEFLGSISSGEESPQEGDLLAQILINPSVFLTTRLEQFSHLYQRYRFTKAVIRYQADANSTQSGSIIGFMDYDVDNLITSDDPLNVKKAAAHFAQEPSKIWQSQEFFLGVVDKFSTLFINTQSGTENRLVYQGVFYLFAVTELPPNSALGSFYFDYEVELSIPALENVPGDFALALSVVGTAAPTNTDPLGPAVDALISPGFPPNNILYSFTASSQTLNLEALPAGQYLLLSRCEASMNDSVGSIVSSTTWEITSANALFVETGLDTQTLTTFNGTVGSGTDASLVRNNFSAVFSLSEYQAVVSLSVSIAPSGTGYSYGDDRMEVVICRLPEVQTLGTLSSRLKVGSSKIYSVPAKHPGCRLLNAKKRVRRMEEKHITNPPPKVSDKGKQEEILRFRTGVTPNEEKKIGLPALVTRCQAISRESFPSGVSRVSQEEYERKLARQKAKLATANKLLEEIQKALRPLDDFVVVPHVAPALELEVRSKGEACEAARVSDLDT